MKKPLKIVIIVAAALVVASLAGLMVTGLKIGWGPFSFLHTWDADVEKLQQTYPAEENQNGIIFYGASNFRMWAEMENDLPEYRVQNHGFGGCTDQDLMHYADKLLYPYHPAIVFFQTGSNDYVSLKGADAKKVAACMNDKKQMFAEIHDRLPDAKLVVMSGLLLPGRSEYRELTEEINQALEALCEETDYLWFVDASAMTWDGQRYADELFIKDGIHLNHEGQLLWMRAYIRPMIEALVSEFDLTQVQKEG